MAGSNGSRHDLVEDSSKRSSAWAPSRVSFVLVIVVFMYILASLWSKSEHVQNTKKSQKTASDIVESSRASITTDPAISLLTVIPSTYDPLENEYRLVVRETWGRELISGSNKSDALLYFFIGTRGLNKTAMQHLENENNRHHDLVFLDFQESYVGLSEKMLLIHMWIHNNRASWPSLRFCLKTDTDTWINIPLLKKLVRDNEPNKTLIGFKYVNNMRLLKGKWANPEYSAPVYPWYMAGAGYLMSADISSWVAVNALAGWLKPLPNEDAMLGIWLAGTPTKFIHSPKFKPFIGARPSRRVTRLSNKNCDDDDVLFHHLTSQGIRILQSFYDTCASPCEASCSRKL